MAVNDKRTDQKWLDQNTYIDKRSKKRTLNKAGRVDLAHDETLEHILPVVLQVPSDENKHYAVVQTTVQTKRGSFTDVGTADPGDAGGKPILQMAAARALNRALDLALNYGRQAGNDEIVALDEDDVEPVEIVRNPLPPASEELIAKLMDRHKDLGREVIESNLCKALKVSAGTDLSTLDVRQKEAIYMILKDWVERTNKGAS